VGLLVPGLALLAGGRPDLIIYAVFGAFTGMYGRGEPPRLRVRHQAQGAAVVVAGVAAGVVLSSQHARPWILVAATVAFAAIGSLVADRLVLRPEGPFFGIFALGATATIPAGSVTPLAAVSIGAATAVFALLVSAAGGADRRAGADSRAPASRPPGALAHAARYALAIAVAGSAGLLLGVEHANWAMAAAAVPLATADARGRADRSVDGVLHRAAHRVIGTLTGLVVTAALLLPHLGSAALALVVIALLFPTELFMARHYGLALGFFTPLIMLMTELANPAEPWALVRDRAVDTLIGVAVGVTVALATRGLGAGQPSSSPSVSSRT